MNDLYTNDFEALCRAKVIVLLSIRVWIEYKLATLSAVPLEDTYFKKVDKFFKNNQKVLKGYPNLKRDLLINKKVMLNQNCHANSQVYAFYYALSVKTDDILKEIKEIKQAFEKTVLYILFVESYGEVDLKYYGIKRREKMEYYRYKYSRVLSYLKYVKDDFDCRKFQMLYENQMNFNKYVDNSLSDPCLYYLDRMSTCDLICRDEIEKLKKD